MIDLSGAHFHLLLNHIPVLGTIFGVGVLIYGWARKSPDILKVSLGFFVLAGLFAGAVYLTGEAAEDAVEHLPGISEALIDPHEDAGFYALIAAGVLGVLSLYGLWRYAGAAIPTRFAAVVLAVGLVSSGVMGWTANLGGQINHPEIRPEATAASVDADADDADAEDPDAEDPDAEGSASDRAPDKRETRRARAER